MARSRIALVVLGLALVAPAGASVQASAFRRKSALRKGLLEEMKTGRTPAQMPAVMVST